jgi:hypothetical protein
MQKAAPLPRPEYWKRPSIRKFWAPLNAVPTLPQLWLRSVTLWVIGSEAALKGLRSSSLDGKCETRLGDLMAPLIITIRAQLIVVAISRSAFVSRLIDHPILF